MKNIVTKQIFVILLLVLFILNIRFQAQSESSEKFIYLENKKINTLTNKIAAMYNVNSKVYNGSPEQIARQFLNEKKMDLGIANVSELKYIATNESHGVKHVGFIQTVDGIPVWGTESVVSINKENRISMVVNGNKNININKLSNSVNISNENAIRIALDKLIVDEKSLIKLPETELTIFQDSLNVDYLTWKVSFVSYKPRGDWLVFVDAINSNLIKIFNIQVNYSDGSGKVFNPNPIAALANISLTDQNDSDYPALQLAYKNVTLKNLNDPIGGLYYLQGKYAKSESLEPPSIPIVSSSSPVFNFNRSQPGFEEVNIYYIIDTYRTFVETLGFSPKWNNLDYLRFDAHANNGYDNINYVPSIPFIAVGDGGIDDGEDQDCILHEYGHALHDALMIGVGYYYDQSKITEGIGDYFALSYRKTLSTFQSNKLFLWDGNGETWNGRSLESSYIYPNDWTSDRYRCGTLWASTMMDMELNTSIGRTVITKLLLKSFSYITQYSPVLEHVAAILQADRDIYNGIHLAALVSVFNNRGFYYQWSGLIPYYVEWSGNIYVTGDITVNFNGTIDILPNTYITFKNGSSLIIDGSLYVNGTSTSNVIFDFINQTSSNSIKINSTGISNINYAEIKNAYNGIYLDNSASTITNCKIHNCTYGIKTNYNTPTIETNKIYDNSYGIYSYQGTPKITDNYIYNIAGYGITINGSTNTFIRKNTLSYCHGGIYAYGNQSIKLRGYSGYSYGLNLIQNYYSDKILYVTGGTADLGEYGYSSYLEGQNNFIKNSTPVIANSTANEILAEKNYWNGTPQTSWFAGSISYDPYLSSANSSAGSTLDKNLGVESDKLLLAEATELSDMKSLVSSSEKFKQLIAEYPESKYAGLAIAWDMSLNKSEGNLYSQKEYLMNNIKHENKLVRENSLLWLETLHSEAGEVKEAENIVQLTSPEETIGTEIRLNYANDLLNLYNEKEKAEEVFNDILKYNKSDDIDYTINVIKEMSNYSENNLKNIQNLAKDIEIGTEPIINKHELFSNYPNPFNPATKIKYNLPYNSKVEITIYDIMGREVKSLSDISNTTGSYVQEWNGTNNYGEKVSSGIYLLKFRASSTEGNNKTYSKTLKLTLLK